MALFNYTAKDQEGRTITGVVEAASEAAGVALIKSKGMFVVSITKKDSDSLLEMLSHIRGIPQGEVVAFTRQLATMIAAGLPLPRALEVLGSQTSNDQMKAIINQCLRDVEGGAPLSATISKYPNVFSSTYKALLRAGEASGKLQDVLLRLADTMETQQDFRSKFQAALIYPTIVSVAMAGVFVIMMVFVVPKLSAMYASLGADLPLPTKIMIGISNFMVSYWWLLLLIVVGINLFLRYFKKTPYGVEFFSRLEFKIPVMGKIAKEKELTEFTQTFSLLIGSGIPIVEALHISSEVVSNYVYQSALERAARSVEKGYSLSRYIRSDKEFPAIVGQMIAVGEETGKLDDVLEKLSKYFQSNADNEIKGLSTAMEPMILILLGVMVGVMVLSIITPIYKLTTSL